MTSRDRDRGETGSTGGTDAGHSREEHSLPPLKLVGEPADPPEYAGGAPGWRRWASLAVAVIVGAAIGVIGTNARHQAADDARIELVAAGATVESEPRIDSGTQLWRVEVTIRNLGRQPVEIVDVGIDGWSGTPRQEDEAEPVVARPDEWTRVSAELTPDCSVAAPFQSPGRPLTGSAVVRTAAGDTAVPLQFATGHSWSRRAWESECAPGVRDTAQVIVELIEVLPREPGDEVLTTRMAVSLPDEYGYGVVTHLWGHVAGFDSTVSGLPVELDGDDEASITVEWFVRMCHAAEEVDDAQLSVQVTRDIDDSTARLQFVPVPPRVLVELGRLSADVCDL